MRLQPRRDPTGRVRFVLIAMCSALAVGGLGFSARAYRRVLRRAQRERARFNGMVDAAGFGMIQLDLEDRIAYANPAGAEMLGYSVAELRGQFRHALLHHQRPDGTSYPDHECPITDAARRGERFSGEEWFIRKDGEQVAVEVRSVPMMINGEVIGVAAVFYDITDRVRERERRTDFVALTSHELRSPLVSVLGFSRRLRQKAREGSANLDEGTLEEIEEVLAAAERMSNTLDLFVDLTRLEWNVFPIEEEPIELRYLLQAEAAEFRHRFADVRLEERYPDHSLLVTSDDARMRQVVTNLLNNAARHGGEHPEVTLSLAHEDGVAVIRVRDRGPGIPEEQRADLFERFGSSRRGDAERGGLGIGLFISKRIADRLGAALTFTTETGQGTEFVFTLPAVYAPSEDYAT